MSFTVRRRAAAQTALLAAASWLPAGLRAQQPPLIPVAHFFDSPQIALARISPDGRWLAYLKPYRGKLNLFLRSLADSGRAERQMRRTRYGRSVSTTGRPAGPSCCISRTAAVTRTFMSSPSG